MQHAVHHQSSEQTINMHGDWGSLITKLFAPPLVVHNLDLQRSTKCSLVAFYPSPFLHPLPYLHVPNLLLSSVRVCRTSHVLGPAVIHPHHTHANAILNFAANPADSVLPIIKDLESKVTNLATGLGQFYFYVLWRKKASGN